MTEACTLGLRIYRRIERPDPQDIARLSAGGPCDISDVARGAGSMDGAIRAMYSPMAAIAVWQQAGALEFGPL